MELGVADRVGIARAGRRWVEAECVDSWVGAEKIFPKKFFHEK